MQLQKIHQVLWDGLARTAWAAHGACTHAEPRILVFQPEPDAQKVSLHFEPEVWKQIVAESGDDARLARIADNVALYVGRCLTRYANNAASNAFKIEIDDHALDE